MSLARLKLSPGRGIVERGRAALARVGTGALDLLYPPRCMACETVTAAPDGLCASCWREIVWIEEPMCDRLGAPLGDEFFIAPDGRRISPIAQLRPPKFSRARGVALFAKGPIRLLVHRLKYGDGEELARPMGRWMARAGAEILADADLLAPIPLHWTRQWRRGFNQASALAASVSAAAGPPVVHNLLTRRRATPTQTMLPPHLRAANLHNAFGIDAILARTRVEGRNIVLIDDVMTTGATLNAAAETLLRAKAARVDALVFALVRPDSSAEPIAAAAAPS